MLIWGDGNECVVYVLQGLVVMSTDLRELMMSVCLCITGFGGDEC